MIIFEATDGVYPFFDKKTPEEIRESARLFYVAMTRAKIRLHIIYAESVSGISKWGNPYSIEKEPTPFLRHIANSFPTWSMHSQTLPLPPLPILLFNSQDPINFSTLIFYSTFIICSQTSCFITVSGRFKASSFLAYVPRIYLSKSNPSISKSANC